jgi:hypothetical protein
VGAGRIERLSKPRESGGEWGRCHFEETLSNSERLEGLFYVGCSGGSSVSGSCCCCGVVVVVAVVEIVV